MNVPSPDDRDGHHRASPPRSSQVEGDRPWEPGPRVCPPTRHRTGSNRAPPAIDLLEVSRGGGGLNVVSAAVGELRPWRDEPVVQDVNERLLAHAEDGCVPGRALGVPQVGVRSGRGRSPAVGPLGRLAAARYADGRPGGAFQARDRGATSGPRMTRSSGQQRSPAIPLPPRSCATFGQEAQVASTRRHSLVRRKPGGSNPLTIPAPSLEAGMPCDGTSVSLTGG
jgi:hypothetical protein